MPIKVTMPALSPTMEEGIISSWLKKEGDQVSDGDAICEIATDKSTVEFQAIDGGFIKKILIPEGGSAKVNELIAVIVESMDEDISELLKSTVVIKEEEKEDKKEVVKEGKAKEKIASKGIDVMTFSPFPAKDSLPKKEKSLKKASPLARKIAKEKGLDLFSVKGSGPLGRVIEKDLEYAQKESFSGTKKEYEYPDGTFEEVSLTAVRKVIGERLQASKMTIPHYVISQKVLMDNVINLRAELKGLGKKVTLNDFVIKATALALSKHPGINSGYDSKKNVIIQYKTVDIAIAVTIPDGLITPILWQSDYLSLEEISVKIKKLVVKAREGSLDPQDYQGGSFTISNLGMFGVSGFEAVINPPQAAILAVAGINEVAVSKEGKISSGHEMIISVSMDHRVIDGAEGAQFINSIKYFLENPSSLLL